MEKGEKGGRGRRERKKKKCMGRNLSFFGKHNVFRFQISMTNVNFVKGFESFENRATNISDVFFLEKKGNK